MDGGFSHVYDFLSMYYDQVWTFNLIILHFFLAEILHDDFHPSEVNVHV